MSKQSQACSQDQERLNMWQVHGPFLRIFTTEVTLGYKIENEVRYSTDLIPFSTEQKKSIKYAVRNVGATHKMCIFIPSFVVTMEAVKALLHSHNAVFCFVFFQKSWQQRRRPTQSWRRRSTTPRWRLTTPGRHWTDFALNERLKVRTTFLLPGEWG